MGTVYKKTYTKPMPQDAELFTRKGEQLARWKDSKGKTRMTRVTTTKSGVMRLLFEAATFTAKYRDGNGEVCEVATGCREETTARQVLSDLMKRCELVKSGVVTAAQDAVIDHQKQPLDVHVDAYVEHLRAREVTPGRVAQTKSRLLRVFADCEYKKLAHLTATGLERWLADRTSAGMSAAARNGYRSACVAFGNWCVLSKRLVVNPLAGVAKADEKADPRRHRRALTEAELVKLLEVARTRPVLDAVTVRRGEHKGETTGKLRTETRARLEMLGRERALIYKTLVLSGLRKSELASLTVAQLDLDGPTPYALLHAADEKNRQGSKIALRTDLAADIRSWLADRLTVAQDAARQGGEAIPARLPDDAPLFTIPAQLVKILDRDLVAAGIAHKVKGKDGKVRINKRDGRGWTIDVHALRTTFGTLLSKGGCAPRTAQAAMRHSTINLTMNTYTDPRLLDVAGAMQLLPTLPLHDKPNSQQQRMTGTYAVAPLAPTLAPATDNLSNRLPIPDKTGGNATRDVDRQEAQRTLENQWFGQHLPTTDHGGDTGRSWARSSDLILVRDAL